MENKIRHAVRDEMLFAGIRKPIKSRAELLPRIVEVTKACGDLAIGPLRHFFRYDTPVEGYDSEVGFEVSEPVNIGEVRTHTLRKLDFFALKHHGPVETLGDTKRKIFVHMNKTGLSPELVDMEIYHHFDPDNPEENVIDAQHSFLAWPEIYKDQLNRVLGPTLTQEIWNGGENINPFTLADERASWVAASIDRLKSLATPAQQFDILSRVALVRPAEDINKYKEIYNQTGDANKVIEAQNEQLKKSPTGGFIDPHWTDGKVLHLSKVARNHKAYVEAQTQEEIRKAFCFCSLVREASKPQMDPIFCYRAAGWARQFWEPILGMKFETCTITHSILKGDAFCAWEYDLPKSPIEI